MSGDGVGSCVPDAGNVNDTEPEAKAFLLEVPKPRVWDVFQRTVPEDFEDRSMVHCHEEVRAVEGEVMSYVESVNDS